MSRYLGKMLLCVIFLLAAYNKAQNMDGTAAYIKSGFDRVGLDLSVYGVDAAQAMPVIAGLAVFLEAGGALALLTGGENCGSAMLLLLLVPATVIMHWPLTVSGAIDEAQMMHCLKNLAIMGGLLILRSSMGVRARASNKDKDV